MKSIEVEGIIADAGIEYVVYATNHSERLEKIPEEYIKYNVDEPRYNQIVDPSEHKPFKSVDLELDDIALLIYTSGTTGRPKGVIHTHQSYLNNMYNQILSWNMDEEFVTIASAPMFHVVGFIDIVLPMLLVGGQTILERYFNPETIKNWIQNYQPNILVMIPTIIATTSFGMGGLSEQLLAGLSKYYEQHKHPQNITFATTAGIGTGKGRGLDHLIAPGLLKRVIASHIATSPLANQAAQKEQFELYLLPQGIIGQLYQNVGSQGPGVFSQVGIDTFIDPKNGGGKLNNKTKASEDLGQRIKFNDEQWLYYKPLPINVAFIKATYADEEGNLSIQRETSKLESLSLATAAHNASGVVIAQVEEIVEKKTIPPKEVYVPGMLVDYVVIADKQYHRQTAGTYYHPALSNEVRVPLNRHCYLPLSAKKSSLEERVKN